nr:MAG TPA: hypothetical protein [Inoviridae sp.]
MLIIIHLSSNYKKLFLSQLYLLIVKYKRTKK